MLFCDARKVADVCTMATTAGGLEAVLLFSLALAAVAYRTYPHERVNGNQMPACHLPYRHARSKKMSVFSSSHQMVDECWMWE